MTGKSRIASKFPRHLFFEGLLINNTELQDILNKNNMHDNANKTKKLRQIGNQENTYVLKLFDKLSYFTLWYEWVNICVYVFISMHMLDFMLNMCSMH